MKTNPRRALAITLVPLSLALGACGESNPVHAGMMSEDIVEPEPWPAAILTSRHGIAVLEVDDDFVIFEGVPFEGSVPLDPGLLQAATDSAVDLRLGGHDVSFVYDPGNDSMVISTGGLHFTVARTAEEVEYAGGRARLGGGSKQAHFKQGGGVEVHDAP
jgi:hypothetical protein